MEPILFGPTAPHTTWVLYRLPAEHPTLVPGRRKILLPQRQRGLPEQNAVDPEVLQPPRVWSPVQTRNERLNRRSCEWLFLSIDVAYLKRKRMHRKPLNRLLDLPLNEAWPRLLERIGDLGREDIHPSGTPPRL